MSYVALYRKYRSQSFDELMGQEQVTVTLQNSIRSGRIAHAYLFYGARGCGKTSTARLLARALNCVAQDGPTPEPCGVCPLCIAIRDGRCLDVMEMDAASETGIDDVREKIVENVQYAPGEARYKVYIIDEVHDLSAKAFDALLKTLEEPPAHVIFILATTEHHKVPITIRSRCANYHFKRGSLQDLARSVQRVIELEGATAEPDAVQVIARAAEGSWRDALSLLEQVLAYSDGCVTAELVHRAIGTVGTEVLARVTDTLAKGDWSETFSIAGELVDSGKDVRQLIAALSAHLRDLMLISAGAHKSAQQELGQERYDLLKGQAEKYDPSVLLAMTAVLSRAERDVRFTNQHRWLFENALLHMMPVNLAAATAAPESVESHPSVVQRTPTAVSVEARPPIAPKPTPVPSAPPVTPVETAQPKSRFAADISLDVIQRSWPRILSLFKKASPQGAPFLEKGSVVDLDGRTIVLAFADSFAKERIQNNAKGKARVEQVVNDGLNTDGYKIRCIARDPDQPVAAQAMPDLPPPSGMGGLLDSADPDDTSIDLSTGDTASPLSGADADVLNGGGADGISAKAIVQTVAVAADLPAQQATGDTGIVAEALILFGGTVVRTEPRVPLQ